MEKEIFIINKDFTLVKKKLKKKENSKSNLLSKINTLDYVNIGWYIIIPILFFLGIGLLLQKYLVKSNIIVVLFVLIGTIGSFYNIFRLIEWKK